MNTVGAFEIECVQQQNRQSGQHLRERLRRWLRNFADSMMAIMLNRSLAKLSAILYTRDRRCISALWAGSAAGVEHLSTLRQLCGWEKS